MPNPEIEEFARILIENVRDAAIRSCDMRFRTSALSVTAKRWKDAASGSTPEDFAKEIIPDIVDETLFQFLHSIDEGLLKISFSASNGKIVDLNTDGLSELAGWYAGTDWRAAYAKERFVDDNADLQDFFKS
jgi:hypothetical protein